MVLLQYSTPRPPPSCKRVKNGQPKNYLLVIKSTVQEAEFELRLHVITYLLLLFPALCWRCFAGLPSPCNAMITVSRKCSERLILLASFRRLPWAPVFDTRSDPAKSTRCNFDLEIQHVQYTTHMI